MAISSITKLMIHEQSSSGRARHRIAVFTASLADAIAKRGIKATAHRLWRIFRTEGVVGLRRRFQFVIRRVRNSAKLAQASQEKNRLSVVPMYLDAAGAAATAHEKLGDLKIGVHLHLYHLDMLEEFATALKRIPVEFDLFVSVPKGSSTDVIAQELTRKIPTLGKVAVEEVPNRGRDIAPFIIQFGERLLAYDVIAHFHSKKTPHEAQLRAWRRDILELLLGSEEGRPSQIAAILLLLKSSQAKIVFAEGQNIYIKDRSGWSANFEVARWLLETHTTLAIEDFPTVEFPEGSMFWARSACLKDFLTLPLRYTDFPKEPIAADGTLAHALERLILIFAS